MKRYFPLAFGMIFLLLLQLLSLLFPRKLILYNYTDSLPHGLYLLWQGVPRKGDLIAFEPPENAARLIRERKYLRDGAYLIKYIVGEKGDSVCTVQRRLKVNGVDYGGIDAVDKEGLPLPGYLFCGIQTDGYIVAIKGMNSSFDSRYYGPIKNGSIIGLVSPLWLFVKEIQ
ncbi:MAG: S26 family signal peptidase [Chlorobiaceae bacterium]|nr:S26 family signal peptidase [Chlorobiaceae bacterium]NTV61766.1 S26 family signal peptidase [Chlorobiaceae bacterium]